MASFVGARVEHVTLHEQPCVRLTNGHGTAVEVLLKGAHVLSYRHAVHGELLFVSRKADFTPAKAVRGGIPVCFPQFANLGPLSAHGFARTSSAWRVVVEHADAACGSCAATFELASDERTRSLWPHEFCTRLTVCLAADSTLELAWTVHNTGSDAFEYTQALHTYFSAVAEQASVVGLHGLDYIDKTYNFSRVQELADAVRFVGEIDRAYHSVPRELMLRTHRRGVDMLLKLDGFADAVVWNPGAERAAAIADLGDGDFRDFVCVESANVSSSVVLAGGESRIARMLLVPHAWSAMIE